MNNEEESVLNQTNAMPNKNSARVDVNSSLSHMLSLPKAWPGYHSANKRLILSISHAVIWGF